MSDDLIKLQVVFNSYSTYIIYKQLSYTIVIPGFFKISLVPTKAYTVI